MRAVLFVVVLSACGRVNFEPEARAVDATDAQMIDNSPCSLTTDDTTVALWTFDNSLTADATGRHDAAITGDVSLATARCGQGAAAFQNGGYMLVQDSPEFDLSVGSIELFVRVAAAATPAPQGVLSRDAGNTDFDGHFTIAIATSGQLWARIQRTGNLSIFRCTAGPIPADTWVHVGVSFGPPGYRAWVDGVEMTGTTVDIGGNIFDCTQPHVFGIEGNDNVFAFGGAIYTSANSTPTPNVIDPLTGAIDQIRIRSTWRDFSN